MAKTRLLTFDTFPQTIVAFDGFDEEALRGLDTFMARVAVGDGHDAAYRVTAAEGMTRRRRASVGSSHRRPWRREIRRGGEDLVVMPGGRVRLAPGRLEAVVELDASGVETDGFVVTSLLMAALIHALAMTGRVVSHAAAFELDGMSVLAVGPTRAGKSTLCAAALAAGGAVVSDDSLILELEADRVPHAGALRRDLWFREGSADLLPEEMRDDLWETESFGEVRLGIGREAHPGCFRTKVGPDAIVFLRRDRRLRDYGLRELSAADGLAGLILASSPLFLSRRYPLERERCMPTLMKTVNGAPCFEVRMGRTLVDQPAATVERLISELCSSTG